MASAFANCAGEPPGFSFTSISVEYSTGRSGSGPPTRSSNTPSVTTAAWAN